MTRTSEERSKVLAIVTFASIDTIADYRRTIIAMVLKKIPVSTETGSRRCDAWTERPFSLSSTNKTESVLKSETHYEFRGRMSGLK